MEGRMFLRFILLHFLHLLYICNVQSCSVEEQYSGEIYFSSLKHNETCWKIQVPVNNRLRLNVKELATVGSTCYYGRLDINIVSTDEKYSFCGQHIFRKPVIALNDVNITIHTKSFTMSFRIEYNVENLICAVKEHFRCSNHSCVYQHQVCDGVQDCENGADEKRCEPIDEVDISRETAIIWLQDQWSASDGWGRNTHRAITALYLSEAAVFGEDNLEEELMVKQLELQTSVALLRNSTDSLSVSELSMFINALIVTCHNPRKFYGHDLLQILEEREMASKSPSPVSYLTLCNGNWTFTEFHVENLLRILQKRYEYPFYLDVHAMTVLALACVRNKTQIFENMQNATKLYNSTVQKFIDNQLSDGSFGNVYTTAVVTQALLSSRQESNKLWNLNSTVEYLMQELNTSADFLSTYLILPILSGKSLVNIANVNCSSHRKHGKDDDVTDITDKLGRKIRIQYSLYIGEHKDVIHTMYMKAPENSSAYETMRLAQVVDPKYKFQHREVSGHIYVYAITGITNDPEAGKYWHLLTISGVNRTVHHHTESPDKCILSNGEHMIMWYKSAQI